MAARPPSWELVQIDEISDINPKLDKSEIASDLEVSFVPMQAVGAETGAIDVTRSRRFSEVEKGYTSFKQRDVLFAKITPCMENGKMAVVPELHGGLGFGSTEFHVLRPASGIFSEYLYFYISSGRFRGDAEHNMTGAVGQRRVPTTYLSQSKIPLPPTNEQRRIVEKIEELFSELDQGIENLKQARAQLAVYRQALLKHAFEGKLTADWRKTHAAELEPADPPTGWSRQLLREISVVSGGLTKNPKRESLPIKMKYLRVANVHADRLDLDDVREIGVTEDEVSKLVLVKGDLLVVEGNGSIDQIGRVSEWKGTIPNCGHQNHLIRVRLHDSILPRFVLRFLQSPLGRGAIVKVASSTTGLHTLSISKVGNLEIPVAPHAEQKVFLDRIEPAFDYVASLEAEIDINLQKSEALRQSILKKAFAGELVPQDPTDEPAAALLARIRTERVAKAAQPKPKKLRLTKV